MFTLSRQAGPGRGTYGIAISVAIHLALVIAWQMVAHQRPTEQPEPERMEIYVPLRPLALPAQQPPAPTSPSHGKAARAAAPATVPRESGQATPVDAPPPDLFAEPLTPTAPASPAERLLDEAKRAAGSIGRDLREERKRRGLITAPPDSPHIRMSKGIAKANEIAPPKWYQAPKVTEIIDPGGYGRRRYRVITGLREYCLTYEGVNSPGLKRGTQPTITTCDDDEQAATKQEWEQP